MTEQLTYMSTVITENEIMTQAEPIDDQAIERQSIGSQINILKNKYNEDNEHSPVLIDPCEIDINLTRKTCEFKVEGDELCALGVVMKEGVAYCPLQEQRQITLRSTFASKEG